MFDRAKMWADIAAQIKEYAVTHPIAAPQVELDIEKLKRARMLVAVPQGYESRVTHQDASEAILDKMLPTVGRYTSSYATLSAKKCAETVAKMEAVLERQATARRGEEIMRAVRLASGGK
jgi:hypothetical protein